MSAISRVRECAYCHSQEIKESPLKQCGGCHVVLYCNRDHQKADWPAHKSVCRSQAKPVEMLAANILKQAISKTVVTSAPISREAADAAGFTLFKLPSSYPAASIPYTQTPLQKRHLATIQGYQDPWQIRSGSPIEKEWKEMGQQIFDEAKRNGGADSQAGREALQAFHETLANTHPKHAERLEYAWNGVGDQNFIWQP